ncbi:hypothetical protein AALP_AA3G119900 [Arabis alpina]|uniref:TF-B3 domain-containing protein n=1 Tax=Arabis alpina TaxID=50452 RepID=A0A087H8N8_ARAAL|nr:hypothetical protein AALP_AA3G119900 [Arabis alpina]
MENGSTSSPKTPHFFKPLLPGFHSHLNIPIAFFSKHLERTRNESSVVVNLRSDVSDGIWEVKMDGQRLTQGWQNFATSHDLRVGDVLVFRHDGDLWFHVTAFGPSCCEIQYDDDDVIQISSDSDSEKDQYTREGEAGYSSDHSCFVARVTASNLSKDMLFLPMDFSRSNGLNGQCEIILLNEDGKPWRLPLGCHKPNGWVYIKSGWKSFCCANRQRANDSLTFKLVQNGKTPVLQLYTPYRFLTLTLTPYNLKSSIMRLPASFVKANGIEHARKITLVDRYGGKRTTCLKPEEKYGRIRLGKGWREFCEVNGVKTGESFELELIKEEEDTATHLLKINAEPLFRQTPMRVHDVIVRGNDKTKDNMIKAEVAALREATTLQELCDASEVANSNLRALGILYSVCIDFDSGPPELPGTTNVVIEVVECKSLPIINFNYDTSPKAEVAGVREATTLKELREASIVAQSNLRALGIFDSVSIEIYSELPSTTNVVFKVVESKTVIDFYRIPKVILSGFDFSVKSKNIFGYGDIWDGSVNYGDDASEFSLGMYFPRILGLRNPFTPRLHLSNQDWRKFSSYKERFLGVSLDLLSTEYHELVYTAGWRSLIDPSHAASKSIKRQLGHSMFSTLKYTFEVDERDSTLRPRSGYAFTSTSQIGGLAPNSLSLRFLKQEFDLRYAVPFGFYHAALNFGVSGGVIFPWGSGYQNCPSSLPERFFLGGDSSFVDILGGPSALWGFKNRGVGPNEPKSKGDDKRDFVGGDAAVTAFADLSFDLPVSWLRENGIHGHVFGCAGNAAKLSENEFRNFSGLKFLETCRTSVGAGIVWLTSLFRMEFNYCHVLKKQEHDRAGSGFSVSISKPS